MTNMPVMDKASGAQNVLSAKGTKQTASSGGSFDSVLKQTAEAGKQKAAPVQKAESAKASEGKLETGETVQKDSASGKAEENGKAREMDAQTETSETEEVSQEAQEVSTETSKEVSAEEQKEVPEDIKEDITDKAEMLEKAGGEMVAALAAQMGISENAVREVMEELEMTDVSLLEPKNVKELMIHLTEGADDMSILTDESFYTAVTEAFKTLENIAEEVQEETGMEPQEFMAAVREAEKQAVAKQEMPEAQNTPNMPGKAQEAQAIQEMQTAQEAQKLRITQEMQTAQEVQEASVSASQVKSEEVTETQGGASEKTVKKMELPKEARPETAAVPKEMPKRESAGKGSENPFMQSSYQPQSLQHFTHLQRAAGAENVFSMLDTQEIMDQIADYMKVSVKPEMTSVEMQLHPESLGSLQIQITHKEGAVTAQFVAQNESVKAALESQVMQLKENLEQQGVKVEAVEVTIAQYSLEKHPEGRGAASEQGKQKRKSVRNLNLRELNLEEDGELTQEERLTAEMMQAAGSTINYTA